MYCDKHSGIIRCCSIQNSKCEECGEVFTTANAPPINSICVKCSEETGRCEYCGEEIY